MKPPMKGASRGPLNTVIEKTVIASPLVLLSNMSENTAATTARGHAPKIPKVCRSKFNSSTMKESTNLPRSGTVKQSANPSQQRQRFGKSRSQTWISLSVAFFLGVLKAVPKKSARLRSQERRVTSRATQPRSRHDIAGRLFELPWRRYLK